MTVAELESQVHMHVHPLADLKQRVKRKSKICSTFDEYRFPIPRTVSSVFHTYFQGETADFSSFQRLC